MVLTEDFQNSLKTRTAATRWGIGNAANYLRGCNEKDFGVSAEQWQKHMEEAAQRLTFCDESFITKNSKDADSATDGAILTFDGICSTRRKDRDGDVIETKGLELDYKMPLLWQHMQMHPVGKHNGLVEQNEKSWSSNWGIAGTALGKDCAILVKFCALRLSIGFQPTELEPLSVVENSAGEKYVTGWHIKKAQVFETSLVSIPANSDAVILSSYAKELDGICTAVSRNLLQHDAVKHWAKSLYDNRTVQVQGVSLKDEQVTKDTMGGELLDGMAKCDKCGEMKVDTAGECQACGHQHAKSVAEVVTKETKEVESKGLSYYPKDSFEQTQDDLNRTARKYLKAKGLADSESYGWVDLYATFKDKAVVCMYLGEGKYKCYSIEYKHENGTAMFTGEPAEVDVEPAIIAKRVGDKIHTKEIVTKEVSVEVVKEVTKELTFDELRKQFMSRAYLGGNEGYKAFKEAAALLEAIEHGRDVDLFK